MSVFDMFRKPQAQSQPQQQPQPQGNQHVQTNPTVPNQTNTPEQQPSAQNPNPESPVDKFKDLWNTPSHSADQNPVFTLQPEQLNQVASKLNFSQGISQETLAKVAAGGDEAVKALGEVINIMGQNIFKNSAQFTSHITEAGYGAAQQQINKGLPTLVKQQLSTSQLFESNPALRDPAIQPVVKALHSQLTQTYPNASPTEINGMLGDYMTRMSGAFGKENGQDKQRQNSGPDNFDFSSFLN